MKDLQPNLDWINYKNVFIWDPTKIICDQDLCDSQKNGDILYFDGDHINAVGNKYFYTKTK